MSVVSSVCCYCGTGCGVLIETKAGKITGVRGDPAHPSNQGKLCTKGATLHLTAQASGRALYPEFRADRAAARERVDWNTALDQAADRFAAIICEHGPDAVGFYISGQLLTEGYYVFNKLAKGLSAPTTSTPIRACACRAQWQATRPRWAQMHRPAPTTLLRGQDETVFSVPEKLFLCS